MHKPKKKGEVNMSGIFEARDKHSKLLYRLFCVVDGQGAEHGLGGPAVVLLDGAVKPVATAVPQADYRRVEEYRDDYRGAWRPATLRRSIGGRIRSPPASQSRSLNATL